MSSLPFVLADTNCPPDRLMRKLRRKNRAHRHLGPALALTFVAAACTLERRDDVAEPVVQVLESIGETSDESAVVHQTLAVFRQALHDGDVAQALRLLDRQARILDDLVDRHSLGTPTLGETRGLQILALRGAHEAGLVLDLFDAELVWLDETAVVTSLLWASMADEADLEGPLQPLTTGWVRESALLRRTGDSWRIVHLHRSPLPAVPN